MALGTRTLRALVMRRLPLRLRTMEHDQVQYLFNIFKIGYDTRNDYHRATCGRHTQTVKCTFNIFKIGTVRERINLLQVQ